MAHLKRINKLYWKIAQISIFFTFLGVWARFPYLGIRGHKHILCCIKVDGPKNLYTISDLRNPNIVRFPLKQKCFQMYQSYLSSSSHPNEQSHDTLTHILIRKTCILIWITKPQFREIHTKMEMVSCVDLTLIPLTCIFHTPSCSFNYFSILILISLFIWFQVLDTSPPRPARVHHIPHEYLNFVCHLFVFNCLINNCIPGLGIAPTQHTRTRVCTHATFNFFLIIILFICCHVLSLLAMMKSINWIHQEETSADLAVFARNRQITKFPLNLKEDANRQMSESIVVWASCTIFVHTPSVMIFT